MELSNLSNNSLTIIRTPLCNDDYEFVNQIFDHCADSNIARFISEDIYDLIEIISNKFNMKFIEVLSLFEKCNNSQMLELKEFISELDVNYDHLFEKIKHKCSDTDILKFIYSAMYGYNKNKKSKDRTFIKCKLNRCSSKVFSFLLEHIFTVLSIFSDIKFSNTCYFGEDLIPLIKEYSSIKTLILESGFDRTKEENVRNQFYDINGLDRKCKLVLETPFKRSKRSTLKTIVKNHFGKIRYSEIPILEWYYLYKTFKDDENFEEISSKLKSIPLWKQNNVLNRELYTFSGKAIDYQSNEEVERILLTTFLEHKKDFLNDFISSNHILCESNKILYTLNTIIEKQPNIIELYNLF